MSHRHVVMFSSGAGSAAAAKLVAEKEGTAHLVLLFADVNGEDSDNYRFLLESARWIGGQLVILTNDGKTIWDVFRQQRFLGNTRADLCSRVLKREPMRAWLEEWCEPESTTCYLGFDWTEEHRWAKAKPHWAPWNVEAPMCWEPVVDKADALKMLEAAGIQPPALTRQGFPHANCAGGCIKAGAKQFRKLLRERPDAYAEWEAQEQGIRDFLDKDVAILRDRKGGSTKPMTLATLRASLEAEPSLFEDGDWGGCGCMTPPDDDPVSS